MVKENEPGAFCVKELSLIIALTFCFWFADGQSLSTWNVFYVLKMLNISPVVFSLAIAC